MNIELSIDGNGRGESLQLALKVDTPHHAAKIQRGDIAIFKFLFHRHKLLSLNGFVKHFRRNSGPLS
jgi:hypothetical protein